jgi:hypothetical protein
MILSVTERCAIFMKRGHFATVALCDAVTIRGERSGLIPEVNVLILVYFHAVPSVLCVWYIASYKHGPLCILSACATNVRITGNVIYVQSYYTVALSYRKPASVWNLERLETNLGT